MATRSDISTEKLNNYPQITCLEFRCDDLSKYADSMLFNSHENEIAYAEFAHKGDIMNIRLVEENDWFEYLFGPKIADTNIYQDGEIYESDLSKASPQEIFDGMIELAVSYFGYDSSSAD